MVPSALHPPSITPQRYSATRRLHSSSSLSLSSSSTSSHAQTTAPSATTIPPPPELKRAPLPAMLAGGLFLFATSVSPPQKTFANTLLKLSETAMRSDPTVAMELGMGLEAGGVFASSYTSWENVDQLVLQFQINGGNVWAQGVAYGVRNGVNEVKLLTLEVANMDAVLNGQSFQVPLKLSEDETAEK
ncbi:hypothetical protein ACHAXR_007823 [Thalassiosira sp. AJA248-18]